VSRAAAALALAAFVALGVSDGMLGPAWPSIRADLHQPLAALGEVTALVSAGAAVVGVATGRIRRRLHAGLFLVAGTGAGAVALALFAASPWWAGLLAAAFVVGAGGAAFDVGFNAEAALRHGPRLTNALHASYGIGATLGPLLAAAAFWAGSWRLAWVAAAGAWAAVALALWRTRTAFGSDIPDRWREADVGPPGVAAVLMLALFFLAVGVEAATGAWGATLLLHRGWTHGAAAAWVAAYWGAFTGGRVVLALVGSRLRPELALRLSSVVLVGGMLVLLRSPAGLPLAGLGVAAFFPALVTLTPFRLGAARTTAAVGRQLAAGTAGATAVVAAAGIVAQWLGPGTLAPFLLGAAVLLAAAELVAGRAA
jgi:fucose permease